MHHEEHASKQASKHASKHTDTCIMQAQKRLSAFKTNLAVNIKSATAKLKHKAQQESLIWGQDTGEIQETPARGRGILTPFARVGTTSIEVAQTSKESSGKDRVASSEPSTCGVIAQALPPKLIAPHAVGSPARSLAVWSDLSSREGWREVSAYK